MRRDSENDRKSDCGFDELDEVMREVRVNGYYISHSEYDENVNALGVPIFGKSKEVIGSLSIVGPTADLQMKLLLRSYPIFLGKQKYYPKSWDMK